MRRNQRQRQQQHLWASEALISRRLKAVISFGLLVSLLDQLSCLGAVVDAVQQAGI